MANIREWHLSGADGTGTRTFTIVEGSPTGRETIFAQGDFAGCTINLQTEVVLRDGSTTGAFTLPEDGSYTANFAKELALGKGDNLVIEATGVQTNTDVIIKISVLN